MTVLELMRKLIQLDCPDTTYVLFDFNAVKSNPDAFEDDGCTEKFNIMDDGDTVKIVLLSDTGLE